MARLQGAVYQWSHKLCHQHQRLQNTTASGFTIRWWSEKGRPHIESNWLGVAYCWGEILPNVDRSNCRTTRSTWCRLLLQQDELIYCSTEWCKCRKYGLHCSVECSECHGTRITCQLPDLSDADDQDVWPVSLIIKFWQKLCYLGELLHHAVF